MVTMTKYTNANISQLLLKVFVIAFALCFTLSALPTSITKNQNFLFSIDKTPFCLLHPTLDNNSWESSTEQYQFYIKKDNQNISMKDYNVLHRLDSSLLIIDDLNTDSLVILSALQIDDHSDFCLPSKILFFDTYKKIQNISTNANQAWAVFAPTSSHENFVVCFKSGDYQVDLYHVTNAGIYLSDHSIVLTPGGTVQSINDIWAEYNDSTDQYESLWIVGTNGLVRRFTITDTTLDNETILDISQDNSFTHFEGWGITSNGSLWEINENDSIIEKNSFSNIGNITFAHPKAMLTDQNKILVPYNDSHITLDGTTNQSIAHMIYTDSGSVIEIQNADGSYTTVKAGDTPTTFIITDYQNNILSPIQEYENEVLHQLLPISITLHDIDKNYSVPNIVLSVDNGPFNSIMTVNEKPVVSYKPQPTFCDTSYLFLDGNAQLGIDTRCCRKRIRPANRLLPQFRIK